MAPQQGNGKVSVAPTVPVSALDRKRPDDQTTAAAVAANQRATSLDAVKSPGELTVFIDNMLADLEARFDEMSQDVLDRMNAMGDRIDVIETAIQDIVTNDPTDDKGETRQTPGVNGNGVSSSSNGEQHREQRAASPGDDSLLLISAPQGMSDDSGSTIGAVNG